MKRLRINDFTKAELHEKFIYDPSNGDLRWKKSGKAAGYDQPSTRPGIMNKRLVMFKRAVLGAHHIAWRMTYDEDIPTGLMIDHHNGNPLDNTLSNLRLATRSENNANRKSKNYYFDNATGVFRLCVMVDGVRHTGGGITFKPHEKEEAAAAAAALKLKLHGEFARR
jgi:hypothetical protein